MNDEELLRYSSHILLKDIDIIGQQNLIASKVLIIGCGGLGNIVASYLVASGVGKIGLIDDDIIELSNLSRQICFDKSDIGKKKALVLGDKLKKLNDNCEIILMDNKLNHTNAYELFYNFDIILDCSDDFLTKKLANKIAYKLKKTFIFASAINFTGYLAVFDFKINNSKCLNCIFPNNNYIALNCVQNGIYVATVSLIGSMVVNEALKIAGKFGEIQEKFIILNSLTLDIKFLEIIHNPDCGVCNNLKSKLRLK